MPGPYLYRSDKKSCKIDTIQQDNLDDMYEQLNFNAPFKEVGGTATLRCR